MGLLPVFYILSSVFFFSFCWPFTGFHLGLFLWPFFLSLGLFAGLLGFFCSLIILFLLLSLFAGLLFLHLGLVYGLFSPVFFLFVLTGSHWALGWNDWGHRALG